jgi:hypothetical protein
MFSLWLISPLMVPNHNPEHLLVVSALASIFGDLTQSKKLSEIKPPLV